MTDDRDPDPTVEDVPLLDGDAPDEPPSPDEPQADSSPRNDPAPED